MQPVKQHLLDIIAKMPDDATYEDMLYEIQLQMKIEKGVLDIESGNYFTNEEAMERLKKWLD